MLADNTVTVTAVYPGQPLPDKSAWYPNTIHALLFSTIDPSASHDIAETTLPAIQQDVAPIIAALMRIYILF